MPAGVGAIRPLQVGLVQAIDVLERIGDREPRLNAEEHGGVAVGRVQIDQQRRFLRDRASSTSPG